MTSDAPSSNRRSPLAEWFSKNIEIVVTSKCPFVEIKAISFRAKIVFFSLLFAVAVFFYRGDIIAFYNEITSPPGDTMYVFLPNTSEEGAFYQDGAVQKRGFDMAIKEAKSSGTYKLEVKFIPMRQSEEEGEKKPIELMKKLYEEKGATYFVMTMSAKVAELRKDFIEWHKECARKHKRKPFLVVTVASAPDLANASGGIVRWYVRSEEETAILAAYLRWKLAVTDAAVFFITRNAGVQNDTYGNRSRDWFQMRFEKLGGSNFDSFPVTTETAKDQVKAFLTRYRVSQFGGTRRMGVFVAGYGSTFSQTLRELIAQGFDGPIVCTSTLTEPDWQPRENQADRRIFTVIPRMKVPREEPKDLDKNVVFFFAKDTLFQLLQLVAADSDPKSFLERWQEQMTSNRLDHDYLANGDAIVRVDVAGADKWRR
jgi:hypothetical protein